ncbi:MAG: M15 family metallopeptidase [Bacteroidota bacterium]|nr:M15 family metallopeptidase [Bacteroidota bacterium]
MRIYQVYILVTIFLFFGCNTAPECKGNKISKRPIIAFNDTFNISASAIKLKTNADTSYLEYVFKEYDLIDIQSLDTSIKVDLKYASTDNFLKLNIYDGLRKAYFPCDVAIRICNAQFYLKQLYPNYSLIIFDASRPLHVQQMMWDSLDMPPNIKYAYLSPPFAISLHNYGCALDVSIIDNSTHKLLEMGSEFDFFGKLSQPVYEWQFLKSGELTQEAFENRKLLRKVMQNAKFFPITSEWWHFNYCNKEFAAAKYKLIK